MRMRPADSRGFSLVELAITLVVMGLLLAFGLPAFHSFSQDQQLHGAAEAIAHQVQLARARAMSTGATQTVSFDTTRAPQTVSTADASHTRSWTLPKGVRVVGGAAGAFTLTLDGRASSSQLIVLQNPKGLRDTISVETSGLVLAR